MKKYSISLSIIFLFCNLQAIKYVSIKDKLEREAADRITLINDSNEQVDVEGYFYLLDGCCPITPFSLAPKEGHFFDGPDAWGLAVLEIAKAKEVYKLRFPDAESIIRSLKSDEIFEQRIRISVIVAAANDPKNPIAIEEIRSPKNRVAP